MGNFSPDGFTERVLFSPIFMCFRSQVIPKTDEEMQALNDSLMKNVLFKYMDEKTRTDIFDVIEPKDYKFGEDIIVQG